MQHWVLHFCIIDCRNAPLHNISQFVFRSALRLCAFVVQIWDVCLAHGFYGFSQIFFSLYLLQILRASLRLSVFVVQTWDVCLAHGFSQIFFGLYLLQILGASLRLCAFVVQTIPTSHLSHPTNLVVPPRIELGSKV